MASRNSSSGRRRRDQAPAAVQEAAALRAEVEHGLAAWPRRRETPVHLGQFDAVAGGADRRRHVPDSDTGGLGEIRFVCLVGVTHSRSCISLQ